jgi:hypothetical protein
MLGRDECKASIEQNVRKPNDKYPPIMIIATSRSGKTLMLETLKTTYNNDPNSGIFVVTCSLNSHSHWPAVGKKCQTSDAPHFVVFVLNLLLFGSVGHHHRLATSDAASLAWITPKELCELVRERHGLSPTTKLLFAIDELTTIFDKFGAEGRAYIVSRLGQLCNLHTQLLFTGFTVEAQKTFVNVSKRKPVLVNLEAVGEENRFKYIPLMTAMLWGIKAHMKTNHDLTYFYCVAHEMTKSSPGLMGTFVERLVFNVDAQLSIRYGLSMWDVIYQLKDLLPDTIHFENRQTRTDGIRLLNEYLITSDLAIRKSAFEGLMGLNMAAPGRLDAFRIAMALMECRSARSTDSPLPPAVGILLDYMEQCNALYKKWSTSLTYQGQHLGAAKGLFFEVACRYGLMLLWEQIKGGAGTVCKPLDAWKDKLCLGDLEVKPFTANFPVNQKCNPVHLNAPTELMFSPNALLYPRGISHEKPESNPLVDLVLNIPTKDGGLLQVWVQAQHTLQKMCLSKASLDNAMFIIDKYNKKKRKVPHKPVREVLYLIVGPRRLAVSVTVGEKAAELTADMPWTLPDRSSSSAPLTLHCLTSPEAREALLGGFISQLVPDFDSHDSALEVGLAQKIRQNSALNRTPLTDESPEQTANRLYVTEHEDKFFEHMRGRKVGHLQISPVNLPTYMY